MVLCTWQRSQFLFCCRAWLLASSPAGAPVTAGARAAHHQNTACGQRGQQRRRLAGADAQITPVHQKPLYQLSTSAPPAPALCNQSSAACSPPWGLLGLSASWAIPCALWLTGIQYCTELHCTVMYCTVPALAHYELLPSRVPVRPCRGPLHPHLRWTLNNLWPPICALKPPPSALDSTQHLHPHRPWPAPALYAGLYPASAPHLRWTLPSLCTSSALDSTQPLHLICAGLYPASAPHLRWTLPSLCTSSALDSTQPLHLICAGLPTTSAPLSALASKRPLHPHLRTR